MNQILSKIPEKPVRTPKWLTKAYPNRARDIADWFISKSFWDKWKGEEEHLEDKEVSTRGIAEARFDALGITSDLASDMEDSVILQLAEAEESKWYQFLEIDDVRELIDTRLQRQIEKDPSGGMRYEYQNLLKVIDALVAMGVDKEHIIGLAHNQSKARLSAGKILEVVRSEQSEEEQQKVTLAILEDVSNEKITVAKFKERTAKRLQGLSPSTLRPVPGSVYMVGGKEIVVIESTQAHTNAIEHALRGIVTDMAIRDGATMINKLSNMIFKKGKMRQVRIVVEKGHPYIRRSTKGVLVPTVEEFRSMALTEIAKSRMLIDQVLENNLSAYVPIFELTHGLPEEEIGNYAMETFQFEDKQPAMMASLAFAQLYKDWIPREALLMFDAKDCSAIMAWRGKEEVYGLFLVLSK